MEEKERQPVDQIQAAVDSNIKTKIQIKEITKKTKRLEGDGKRTV